MHKMQSLQLRKSSWLDLPYDLRIGAARQGWDAKAQAEAGRNSSLENGNRLLLPTHCESLWGYQTDFECWKLGHFWDGAEL